MRNFIEKLKDILYDGIDYILIIGIIAVIAFTINWKLNGIFAVADVDELYSQSSDTNESTEDKDKSKKYPAMKMKLIQLKRKRMKNTQPLMKIKLKKLPMKLRIIMKTM